MTRLWQTAWIKWLNDMESPNPQPEPPPKPKYNKQFWIGVLGAVVDGVMIGLLLYTLIIHSCEICFSTGVGATTYKECKSYSEVLTSGMPSAVISNVYEQQGITKANNLSIVDLDIK
jgi:hypothetical protein